MVELSPASQSGDIVLVLEFPRVWIDSMAIEPALRALRPLVADRAGLQRYAGTALLYFPGWDTDDGRELWDIEEVRRWFHALTVRYPYWLVLCDRRHAMIGLVFNLLVGPGTPVPGGSGRPPGRIQPAGAVLAVEEALMAGMATLCRDLGIPEAVSARWRAEALQALQSSIR